MFVRSQFAHSKIMTLKIFYPKLQCSRLSLSQSASHSLSFRSCIPSFRSLVRSLQSSKVYEDFGKTFIKVVRQLSPLGDAMCACVFGSVFPYVVIVVAVAVVSWCVRLPARKLIVCVYMCVLGVCVCSSHLENRLNILSIRGNKNKFFSFRDLISCFCWERVSTPTFVCESECV